MTQGKTSESGFSTSAAAIIVSIAALLVILAFFARPLRRFIHEWFMQRVTSSHYEILCPPGVLPPETMRRFASERESLFTSLNRKVDDAGSNVEIRVIFDGDPDRPVAAARTSQPYEVTGTTVRTTANGLIPRLDSAADAEALLHAVWGKPGNPRLGRWTAVWLVGDWHGVELGMVAAGVEQQLGHKTVSTLLGSSPSDIPSENDRTLLGAAWLSEIAELDGPAEIRKLYAAKMPNFDTAEVSKTISSTPLELERKWQMWMYAHLAGMPADSQSMPMGMHMPGQ